MAKLKQMEDESNEEKILVNKLVIDRKAVIEQEAAFRSGVGNIVNAVQSFVRGGVVEIPEGMPREERPPP